MNSFNDFPEAEDLAIRNIASKLSYEDFVSQLNEDIDLIIADMMDGVVVGKKIQKKSPEFAPRLPLNIFVVVN